MLPNMAANPPAIKTPARVSSAPLGLFGSKMSSIYAGKGLNKNKELLLKEIQY